MTHSEANISEKISDHRIVPQISIIVPVYNVAPYLPQSLASIADQSFIDWECIIVDDGSTDSSAEICDEFAAKDRRFKTIHKQNGGVSDARNAALDIAKGNYIAFVDPDDWVEPDYLETLLQLAKKYNADVVQCGFRREFTNHSHSKPLTHQEKSVNHDEAMLGLLSPYKIPTLLWNKLFRREVISQHFPKGLNYEDAYIIPVWFRNVKSVALTPQLLYHYRMRKKSITRIGIANNHYNFVTACANLGKTVNQEVPHLFDANALNIYLYKILIAGAKTIARKEPDVTTRREVIKKLSRDLTNLKGDVRKRLGLKLRFRGYLLAKKPVAFEKLMRFVNKFDIHSKFRTSQHFD